MRPVPAILLAAITASPAWAQRAPEIVIPGKPGVPVYINGIDASWGIVEGDFGLDRPGMVTPTVIWRPLVVDLPENVPGFHPATGKRPGYGRFEVVPPPDRPLPRPAPTYYRSWSSGSSSAPVTEYAPYNGPAAVGFGNNNFGHRHSPKSPGPKGPGGPPKRP
ncbi:MAG: hypothetical protein WBD71_19980 [Xanthobacteraceae bacterium]